MRSAAVSVVDFIRTGKLAGCGLGDEMRLFGERFGVPENWESQWSEYYPQVWQYGDVQISMKEVSARKIVSDYILIQPGYKRENRVSGSSRLRLISDGVVPGMELASFLSLMHRHKIPCKDGMRPGLKPEVGAYLALDGVTFATFWHDDETELNMSRAPRLSALEAYVLA